jgi:hypothetical protein
VPVDGPVAAVAVPALARRANRCFDNQNQSFSECSQLAAEVKPEFEATVSFMRRSENNV